MNFKDKNEIIKAILYRLLPTLLVFILALIAFNHGVYLEGKLNICTDTIFVQIYYTIGLFLLAGIDFGMPLGGTEFYRILLYIAYFLAPLITVFTVIEAVVRSINPTIFKKSFKNHIVIVGAGKLAIAEMNFYKSGTYNKDCPFENMNWKEIADKWDDIPIILVEKDANNNNLEYFREYKNIKIIIGDITHSSILCQLNIKDAIAFWIFTNKDIINVNFALRLKTEYGILAKNILVRLEDDEIRQNIYRKELKYGVEEFRYISVHKILSNVFLFRYIESILNFKTVVIYGFGRFGQNILEIIIRNNSLLEQLVIVDPEAKMKFHNWLYRKKLQNPAYTTQLKTTTYNTKQEDSQILNIIKEQSLEESKIGFIMCANLSNNQNIKTAINIAESFKKSMVFLRSVASIYEKSIGIDSKDISGGTWYSTENEKMIESINCSHNTINLFNELYESIHYAETLSVVHPEFPCNFSYDEEGLHLIYKETMSRDEF